MTPAEQRLFDLLSALGDQDVETLLAFAEFLAARAGSSAPAASAPPAPKPIPRPEGETVVRAIKRLSETYEMIDKRRLFHKTSELMSQHVMEGRAADEVIDELERVFEQEYQQLIGQDDDR
ncbi:MAG: Crp/Fnr family transcriptional regulator [Gammaproteobacteria bacterium]|nr:Crp/Fnr family transcriptional regulator [Gammaproteobacteria bacterium]